MAVSGPWWRERLVEGRRHLRYYPNNSRTISIFSHQRKRKRIQYSQVLYIVFFKSFFLIQYIKIIKNINKNVNSILFKVNIFLESIKNKNYHSVAVTTTGKQSQSEF
jgi:hypothetical protein